MPGEKEYSGGIAGLLNAGYRRVESFPTNLQKDEVIIHELNIKNKIIFLAFYIKDGIPECKEIHTIDKK